MIDDDTDTGWHVRLKFRDPEPHELLKTRDILQMGVWILLLVGINLAALALIVTVFRLLGV